MSRLAIRAEVRKLARTLAIDPAGLDFLHDYAAEHIRRVREAHFEQLFRQEHRLYERLGRWFGWLPAWTLAVFARILGPLVVARVAGELKARRAAAVCARLTPGFLADAAEHLDPRTARDLLRRLPTDLVVATAQELGRRGDTMTVGRFVDFISEATLQRVVAVLDDRVVLGAAFYNESRTHLDHIVRLLPEERLRRILSLVDDSSDNAIAVLAVLTEGSHSLRRMLGDLLASQPDTVQVALIRSAHAEGLWAEFLPVLHSMSPESLCQVVNLPILEEPDVLESIGNAADAQDLWGIVLPLIEMMEEKIRAAVARGMGRRPRDALARMVQSALIGEHWEPLLDVVARMPQAKQAEFADIVGDLGEVDPDLRDRVAARAAAHGIGERFAPQAVAA